MTDTEVKMLFYFLFFIPGIIALLLFIWKAHNLSSQREKTFGIKTHKINFLSNVFPLMWLTAYLTWVWIMRDRGLYTHIAIVYAVCIYIYCAANVIPLLKKDSLQVKRKIFTNNLIILSFMYFIISLLTE